MRADPPRLRHPSRPRPSRSPGRGVFDIRLVRVAPDGRRAVPAISGVEQSLERLEEIDLPARSGLTAAAGEEA